MFVKYYFILKYNCCNIVLKYYKSAVYQRNSVQVFKQFYEWNDWPTFEMAIIVGIP
jgi:hypothetical protein